MTKITTPAPNNKKRKYVEEEDEVEAIIAEDSLEEGEFEIEAILLSKGTGKDAFYFVKWKHYPLEGATWEPIANLEHLPQLIEEFETVHKKNINPAYLNGEEPDHILRKITAERKTDKGELEYECHWKHFVVPTWEPASDEIPQKAIDKYNKLKANNTNIKPTKKRKTSTLEEYIREYPNVKLERVKRGNVEPVAVLDFQHETKEFPISEVLEALPKQLANYLVEKIKFVPK